MAGPLERAAWSSTPGRRVAWLDAGARGLGSWTPGQRTAWSARRGAAWSSTPRRRAAWRDLELDTWMTCGLERAAWELERAAWELERACLDGEELAPVTEICSTATQD